MTKPSLKKNIRDTIWPIIGRVKGVDTFPKGFSPKGKVIIKKDFEITYHDITV